MRSEVRTRPTFLATLISKSDSGPVKLPGLSRNGPLDTSFLTLKRVHPNLKKPFAHPIMLLFSTELKNDGACVTYGQSASCRRENLDSSNKFLM